MAHTVTTQVLESGASFVVVKVTILGDGASGELTNQVVFNASDYSTDVNDKLMDIEYALNGFSGVLNWDATTPVQLMSLISSHPYYVSYLFIGGLVNNGGIGQTGDIKLTTTGLASTAKDGHIILRIKWR